ncbi:hypothetical protein EU99_1598 [Prochlorococcus marinus str. MIT 9321]|uniref:DUF1818 domain-containing protein n=1 Tax=Prochlorococcus marinus str. MIT 9401 TaxID=167551 RepID=A0A0A2B8E1_PROMR|nr:DUF1818 family protein [Prochlorococcus marinus]KGG02636.1 hypothetical protein EU99_1598 [Prochlorococcus marinus str. MIT 9321]KGG05271.1 hypothetical protein EV00_0904 [Prochlorococcus marinus str. MIT 9322]KGG10333.1 hypothetical protein EV01_0236 [Prochlorococcus marinus str. MIT 9401]
MVKDQKRWRLLRDFRKGKFCFLIGVDNWSIELQKSEFHSLYLLLVRINKQLLDIKNELLDEELITLNLEQLPWYIELEGKKNEWSLRFVFESQDQTRSFEMYWPIPIAKNLFYEIKKMWESMD